jgi:hypothetical protein
MNLCVRDLAASYEGVIPPFRRMLQSSSSGRMCITNCEGTFVRRTVILIIQLRDHRCDIVPDVHSLIEDIKEMCTRFLHACSALCKCANWLCRTCTLHHTVAGKSSVSLTQSNSEHSPQQQQQQGPSPHQLHAGPCRSILCTRARHSSTHDRTLCAVHGFCTSDIK